MLHTSQQSTEIILMSSLHPSFSGPWMQKMRNMSGTGHKMNVTGKVVGVMCLACKSMNKVMGMCE